MIYEGNETYNLDNGKAITLDEFRELIEEISISDNFDFFNILYEELDSKFFENFLKELVENTDEFKELKNIWYTDGYEKGFDKGRERLSDDDYNDGYEDGFFEGFEKGFKEAIKKFNIEISNNEIVKLIRSIL